MDMISLDVKETWTINDIERSRKYIYKLKNSTPHSVHSFCSFHCPVRVKTKPHCTQPFSTYSTWLGGCKCKTTKINYCHHIFIIFFRIYHDTCKRYSSKDIRDRKISAWYYKGTCKIYLTKILAWCHHGTCDNIQLKYISLILYHSTCENIYLKHQPDIIIALAKIFN